MKKQIVVCDCCSVQLEPGKDSIVHILARSADDAKEYDFCEPCSLALSNLKSLLQKQPESLSIDAENLLYAARGLVRCANVLNWDEAIKVRHESEFDAFRQHIDRVRLKVEVIDKKLQQPRDITQQIVGNVISESKHFTATDDFSTALLAISMLEELSKEKFFIEHYPQLTEEITTLAPKFDASIRRLADRAANPLLESKASREDGESIFVRAKVFSDGSPGRLTKKIVLDVSDVAHIVEAYAEKMFTDFSAAADEASDIDKANQKYASQIMGD